MIISEIIIWRQCTQQPLVGTVNKPFTCFVWPKWAIKELIHNMYSQLPKRQYIPLHGLMTPSDVMSKKKSSNKNFVKRNRKLSWPL